MGTAVPVKIVSFVMRLFVFSETLDEYISKSLSANSLVLNEKLYSLSIERSNPCKSF